MRKIIVLLMFSMLLAACRKVGAQEAKETNMESSTEETKEILSEEPDTPAPKDISEYEDRTIVIPGDSFKEIAENANLIPVMISTGSGYSLDTIEDLYRHSEHVVRGKIIDLTYTESGKFGATCYSFAIEEVLGGKEMEPETIVSLFDNQGYVRLKTYQEEMGSDAYSQYSGEEADRTYFVQTSGEPLVEIGEEYVLFLYGARSTWQGEETGGYYYEILSPFLGKFKLNEDGLYERFLPEYEKHLYQLAEPLSLEEIKEQIAKAEKNTGE